MSFSPPPPPPVFVGEYHNIWAVEMKTYLQAHNLWSVVLADIEPLPLRANPTIAQIRLHNEDTAKKYKAMSCLQNGVSNVIFTRIMACGSPKQAWDRLKEEFQGSRESSSSSSGYKGKKLWLEKKEKEKKDVAKKKFPPCTYYKKSTHLEKYCWYRPDIQCISCKQLGHIEKVCKNKAKTQPQQQNQAKAAEDIQVQEEALDKGMFRELDTSFVSKFRNGNSEFIEAKGKGKAMICTQSGKTCTIKDPSDQVLVTVAMHNRSFILDVNQLEAKAHTTLIDESCLWHKRLGYENYNSLGLLHKMNLVEDMSKIEPENDVYEVCQLGKQTRLPFPVNKAWRAQKRLQVVHTDICRPMKTSSLNGSRYFALFIDDCTRSCWVSFLKQKSDVAYFFCKFKALALNQTNCKLKTLRSDNRTEYVSQRFQKISDEVGIQHQLTTIYTPQQNGVCERKNKTVFDMAR
ncbi:uncharacterized protein LOC108474994 [Gossypium arboreum]|uniref:uncharacterized protein LOC108474994 n=1 Tax=Gossypium arboreum TaxID=29729 RepID=UPI000818FA88|nr:uncharacterized protein LOC108474994 [Gossypium arboreum]